MCTVITLQRPGHPWPLLLAANRDERVDRPWTAPGEHWPGLPGLVAGQDTTGGGTWMGLNRHGLVAAILNRQGSLGPAPGKRSRGELPLRALASADAATAAAAIMALDGTLYRSFNLVLADRTALWFVRNDGSAPMAATALPPGLHMITAHDPDDPASPRTVRHLPRFRATPAPEPPDWTGWELLLADECGPRSAALAVPPEDGFGTVCASLLGLPAEGAPVWRFAPGRPGQAAFTPVQPPGGGEPGARLL